MLTTRSTWHVFRSITTVCVLYLIIMKIKVKNLRTLVHNVIKESIDNSSLSDLKDEMDDAYKEYADLSRTYRKSMMKRNPKSGPGRVSGPMKSTDLGLGGNVPSLVPNKELQGIIDQMPAAKERYDSARKAYLSVKEADRKSSMSDEELEGEKNDNLHRAMYGGNINNPRGLGS